MPFDTENLLKNIPEELAREEVINLMRERLKDDPKNDPMTSITTMAASIIAHLPDVKQKMLEFSKELEGDYPAGDVIVVGALYAAAGAYAGLILNQQPLAAFTLGQMREMGNALSMTVFENVKAMIESTGTNSRIILDNGTDFSVALRPVKKHD